MAVTISNVIRNHRGLYFEVTGDGNTTALVASHNSEVPANMTASATVITSPTTMTEKPSGKGGFTFPAGTSQTVSSVSVSATQVTVNTQSAIGNGTKAYVSVVFNQPTATL